MSMPTHARDDPIFEPTATDDVEAFEDIHDNVVEVLVEGASTTSRHGSGANVSRTTASRARVRSWVWDHFKKEEIDGEKKAICNYCKSILVGHYTQGTKHLIRHHKSCKRRIQLVKGQQRLSFGKKEGDMREVVNVLPIDKVACKEKVAKLVVMSTAGDTNLPTSLEKQFEDFRAQLEEARSLRERVRGIVMEIESTARLMQASLLLVHQFRPLPEVLEKPKAQVDVLKELYNRLAQVLHECTGEYYRYHGDWRSETQNVVSLLAFMHWLESGTLLMHKEAEQKLGLNEAEFALDIEDYLIGELNVLREVALLNNFGMMLSSFGVKTYLMTNFDFQSKSLYGGGDGGSTSVLAYVFVVRG